MQTLSLLLWTPAIGALIIALIPESRFAAIRMIALASMLLSFGLAWSLAFRFNSNSFEIQFAEMLPWNRELGSSYALGVDGFALPMLLLASLLSLVALLASYGLKKRVKGYHVCLLMLEFGMLGVFMAQDWTLFYVFWELTLIPLFFLIDQWGGKRRHTASLNFVLYTMGGSIFMLISLLLIYMHSPEHSTGMAQMSLTAKSLPLSQQLLVFFGFLIGFGVKIPIFPLHGWLPLAHVEAPSPVSILLSGALLKMGAYGLLRVVGMLPEATLVLQPLLAAIALISIVYGGLLAWRQSDVKAMIAYSSISHMGVVLLGISSLTQAGLMGATLQMTAHGLVAGGLFLMIGLLYERTHTREIADYSSLVQVAPKFAFFTTVALLAGMGLPGTAGFIAELHVLIGGYQRWGLWVLFLSFGVLVSAAYAMRTIARLFTGPVRAEMQHVVDLKPFEWLAASALVLGIFAVGLAPSLLTGLVAATVNHLNVVLP